MWAHSPYSGHFRYFMVLIDASTQWSHVSFLSIKNIAFARLLAQIIRLWAQFPNHPTKTNCLDNVGEFSSQIFLYYRMSLDIDVQYPVAYVHTQNGPTEYFIKCLQSIARPLLLKTKLPLSAWGMLFYSCEFNFLLSYNQSRFITITSYFRLST